MERWRLKNKQNKISEELENFRKNIDKIMTDLQEKVRGMDIQKGRKTKAVINAKKNKKSREKGNYTLLFHPVVKTFT